MVINNKEIDFSISNLKHAGAMELALKHMSEKEAAAKVKDEKAPMTEVIRLMLSVFRDFFIEATGIDVLEDCEDLIVAKKAYLEFLNEVHAQKKVLLSPFSLDRIE